MMDHDDEMFDEPDDEPVELCEADAIRGTGTGVCLAVLTPMGDCPRVAYHLEKE